MEESIQNTQRAFMLMDLIRMTSVQTENPSGTATVQKMLSTEEYNKVKTELFKLLGI